MTTKPSAGSVRATYMFIKAHRAEFNVQTMCRVKGGCPERLLRLAAAADLEPSPRRCWAYSAEASYKFTAPNAQVQCSAKLSALGWSSQGLAEAGLGHRVIVACAPFCRDLDPTRGWRSRMQSPHGRAWLTPCPRPRMSTPHHCGRLALFMR